MKSINHGDNITLASPSQEILLVKSIFEFGCWGVAVNVEVTAK